MALLGSVKALIQAQNGHVFAGTNSAARIYRSTDNGQTWTQIVALGSGSDSVNAFCRVNSTGELFAALSGSVAAQGIWRSTDQGVSWGRVKSHPSSLGYYDIANYQGGTRVVAVGDVTAANQSPVTIWLDRASPWIDIRGFPYYRKHIAIATTTDSVTPTPYSGENPGNLPHYFIGTDSYYTEQYGTDNAALVRGFSTLGGGAGINGLDMAAFLVKSATGTYQRRALWAVRSAANNADTSIWQWPPSPSSAEYSFSNITTVFDTIFNVLYVDPVFNWQDIGSQRTVWAGANGTIYVSYNSGLSWAVATTAPTGQIYSFVRTTSGVLIAGGANGEIFLFGGSGSEGGGGTTDPGQEEPDIPTPSDPGLATARVLGQESTDEEKIFIANKFSFSNLTHVFYYSGSTWSNIQYSTLPPYSLLGTGGAVGRTVYFGSKTTDPNVPGGPFSSLVFDIVQEARSLTIAWEYWNGSTWTTLTTTDNTDQFRKLGVNNVTWAIPSNWATVAVNSITGYWVRARITAVGSDAQTPIQGNRFVYTALLPYLNIHRDEIQGDLPALGRMIYRNRSLFDIERMICGLRRADRGAAFNAYLNISDVQTPFGVTVSKGSSSNISWQTDIKTPTGRGLLVNLSSGEINSWQTLVTFTLDNTVARDYYGYYHAYLRCHYNHASLRAWNLRLKILFGSGGSQAYSQTVYPTSLSNWEAVDLGQIAIPTTQLAYLSSNLGDQLKIIVEGYCNAASRPLALYDLILIPTDEWAVDVRLPELDSSGTPQIVNNYFLEIDSISNPKAGTLVFNRNSAGQIVARYQTIQNGPLVMQKEADQRFWYLGMSYEDYWRAYPEILASAQIFKLQQYLGFRGTS